MTPPPHVAYGLGAGTLPVDAVLKKLLVLFVAVAVGEGVEKRDMISALAV